jgi:hypothetical protein
LLALDDQTNRGRELEGRQPRALGAHDHGNVERETDYRVGQTSWSYLSIDSTEFALPVKHHNVFGNEGLYLDDRSLVRHFMAYQTARLCVKQLGLDQYVERRGAKVRFGGQKSVEVEGVHHVQVPGGEADAGLVPGRLI